MGTSILTDTVKDPGGNVVATSSGTTVNFRLMANGSPTPGFRISDGVNVASLLVTSASTTGAISQALENNSNVVPVGTYYVAEILCPSSQGGTQEWAILSSSSTSPQNFRAALISAIPSYSPPTTVPPTILSGNNTFTGTNQFNGTVSFKGTDPWIDITTYGARIDGVTDDTAAVATAIANLPDGGILHIPYGVNGRCKVTSPTTFFQKSGITVRGTGGRGGSGFQFSGPPTTNNVIFLQGCRDCEFEDLYMTCATAVGTMFTIQTTTSTVSTRNVFRRVYIQGTGGCANGFATSSTGVGGDANNDLMVWEYCQVDNVQQDAWQIGGSQSKEHTFIGTNHNTCQKGVHQINGSFQTFHHGGGNATQADFYIEQPNDYITIHGGNFEGSNRFLTTVGPTGVSLPVTISNVRWAANGLNADGNAVYYDFGGPLYLNNNSFGIGTTSAPLAITVHAAVNLESVSAVSVANTYHSTLTNVFTGSGSTANVPVESYGDRFSTDNGTTHTASSHRFWGTGSPEGAIVGSLGDSYFNKSGGAGTTLYVKEGGAVGSSTGWVGK